jgi:hypothetical protein
VTIEDLATRSLSTTLDVVSRPLITAPLASLCVKFEVLESLKIVLKGLSSEKYSTRTIDDAFFPLNTVSRKISLLPKDKDGTFSITLTTILLGKSVPNHFRRYSTHHLLMVRETLESISRVPMAERIGIARLMDVWQGN